MLDEKHFRIQEAEATIFMNNLLDKPNKIFDYVRLYTSSVASSIIWGERAADFDSYWYKEFYELMDLVSGIIPIWLETQEPGANPPIDEFPFLKYLPGNWKKRADRCRTMMDNMWDRARGKVNARRARGIKRDCFIDAKLDEYNAKGWPMNQHAFNNLFGELLEAGADTTANHILTLILAFAKHPEVQVRARKEIDALCGTERAPVFSDFEKLPYINCIVKEGMRWRPTATTGLPHCTTEDDTYDGMFIPKGTMVFLGIWAIHHDENIFPDHEAFNPDRYIKHPKLASDYTVGADYNSRDKFPLLNSLHVFELTMYLHHYGYGGGRRICPGIHLAERNMWRIAAKLLWAFEISEPVDPVTGKVIPLDSNAYNSAILLCPLPYTVKVVPRSEAHLACIRKELDSARSFMSQWDQIPNL